MFLWNGGYKNMNLLGKEVEHKLFGIGKIHEIKDDHVSIEFSDSGDIRTFSYPGAFEDFLMITDKDVKEEMGQYIFERKIEKIEKDKLEREKKKAEALEAQELADSLNKSSHHKKTSSKEIANTNVAFKCNYCDGGKSDNGIGFINICSKDVMDYNIEKAKHVWCTSEECPCHQYYSGDISKDELDDKFDCSESRMLVDWKAYAGIVQNGKNAGRPMKVKNVALNSLAVLTSRLPYAKDDERFIFGAFIVNDKFEGDDSEQGTIKADPVYRIQLTLEEAKQMKFWDYYFNPSNPQRMVFGSGLFRYLTDVQAAQILRKICQVKEETNQKEQAEKLYEHYCKIKGLDSNNIPEPQGALYQIQK